eukprot:6381433-Alexandrium_andersonii.AAC.1
MSRCKLQRKSQRKSQRKLRGQPWCRSICRPRADRGECAFAARATCAGACAATCSGLRCDMPPRKAALEHVRLASAVHFESRPRAAQSGLAPGPVVVGIELGRSCSVQ